MQTESIVVQSIFDVSIDKVWAAITNKDEMAQWYFKLEDFKPQVGFVFEFTGGPEDGIQYLHHCEITEVTTGEKLIHTWKYIGYSGESVVCWELADADNKTVLKLTHAGLDTFPSNNPDFSKENFVAGWNYIINTSLTNYLRTDS